MGDPAQHKEFDLGKDGGVGKKHSSQLPMTHSLGFT